MEVPFEKFSPHPLVKGGHLQTILARLWSDPLPVTDYELIDITFENGDRTYARVDHPPDARPETPIIALFHGLGGCSESPYKLRISARGKAAGLRVARFNHRGCGPSEQLHAQHIYHSGSYPDVMNSLQQLANKYPKAPIALVGFSLSGAMVLNLVGHHNDIQSKIPQLKIACAVCPPIDLVSCSYEISRFRNIIYDQYYSFYLLRHVKKRSLQFDLPPPKFSRRLLTLALFDNEFTAPLAGYKDAKHYYQECSPSNVVANIKLPTLILAAADDPVVNRSDFARVPISPAVTVRIENSGGHMGFLSHQKTPFGDYRWLETSIVSWAQANLKN
jgi:predicted alpha/beta-fold hydrolase